MGFLTALWLPILLSAVFVFVVSSIIHMMLPYHKNDFKVVPNESGVMDALRPFNLQPGDYFMPRANSGKEMKSPEFVERLNKGPVAIMTIVKPGVFNMAPSLILWFVYCLVVSIFAAYLTSHAISWGTPYIQVFRFIGTSAFMGYSLALCQRSIWYKQSWTTTFKSVFDGLIYALVTAGTFGWLWPTM